MKRAAIAFGSNLGDRVGKIVDALKALRELDIEVTRLSRLYESAPAYVTDQPAFLNGAALIQTSLQPIELLHKVKQVEAALGRQAGGQRWGPRPIDLDIIFYEDSIVHDGEKLIVPHPRWQERGFVKAPLADLAPVSAIASAHIGSGAVQKDSSRLGLAKNLGIAAQLWSSEGGETQLGDPDLYCVMPMGRLGLWPWQGRSHVMGILNVTPDSFSDGGKFQAVRTAVDHAKALIAEGADIIDVGGQSTRPGAERISVEEECKRVLPVIKALAEDPITASIPLSIDTFYAEVATRAVESGATMVNDVSGGSLDPQMVSEVATLGVPFIAMHMRGDPTTMQSPANTKYDDVVDDVAEELRNVADRAVQGGIEPWRLILDPGVGFAKTVQGNIDLIAGLRKLRWKLQEPYVHLPILVGPSRKGFLGQLTGRTVAEERDAATVAAAVACALEGANIIRAHNVAAVRDGVRVADAVAKSRSLQFSGLTPSLTGLGDAKPEDGIIERGTSATTTDKTNIAEEISSLNVCSFDEKVIQPRLFDASDSSSLLVRQADGTCHDHTKVPENSKFPFWFGTATAAHQIEGASTEDGKGPSIWNWFEHLPGKVADGTTADVADDFYHKFEEDAKLMNYLGIRNFRMSISWPRIFPTGRPPLNQPGIDFYKRVIKTLRDNCIEPHLTLYHWDLPLTLYEEYGGWIDPRIEDDFVVYAETVWTHLKDDVQYWTTFNEPETFCVVGYEIGIHAPGRCSDRSKCPEGNSTTEGWKCAYHVINAHAKAERVFRKVVPNGKLGINLSMGYMIPSTDSEEDKAACQRAMEYNGGRYLDPLYYHDWSDTVKTYTPQDVLPLFSDEQKAALQSMKMDYLPLNHYTSRYCGYDKDSQPLQAYVTDRDPQGNELPVAGLSWLRIVPHGLRKLLVWLKDRYNNPIIFITENGMCQKGEEEMTMQEKLCDVQRVKYYKEYIGNASLAKTEDGVNLQGYFAWSMLDNFEWAEGLNKRFGIIYVDYESLNRYFKASSLWLSYAFGVSDKLTAVPDAADQ